jgi:hypothetical protein
MKNKIKGPTHSQEKTKTKSLPEMHEIVNLGLL